MSITRIFPREVLPIKLNTKEVVLHEALDSSYWATHYRLVFKHEDNFYETSYSKGHDYPWQDTKQVTCTQVEPIIVTTTKWVPKQEI